ncbi:MAG: hypothetical protein KIT84_36020 [Labilithrix sp.]|nr:hypothetical protein [Labilithrix sp.]MCW5816461.1 hypothetical protein [Labilithrix sp.]
MKACPNAHCPHRLQYGTPAPYLATAVQCRHCAGHVVPIEHLERAARSATTVLTGRGPRLGEGMLFFLGLAGVVVPHMLAQAFGNVAYALPVLALAYGLSRLPRRSVRSTLDTTVVRAVRAR